MTQIDKDYAKQFLRVGLNDEIFYKINYFISIS